MGGNSRAIDRNTGEVRLFHGHPAYAQKIMLRKFQRDTLCRDFIELFHALNDRFHKRFGRELWKTGKWEALFLEGQALSGSSYFLFNHGITDEELLTYKPVIGDLDVMIRRDDIVDLFTLLSEIEKAELTPSITYVGQNRKTCNGSQINAVFEYDQLDNHVFAQVDFEGVEFVNGAPSEFARFSHNSAWEDVEMGIKGLAHKYWLMCLLSTVTRLPDAIILTDKSPLSPVSKVRMKKLEDTPKTMTFSVDRGLRVKLQQQYENGNPVIIQNNRVYKEISPANSDYITNLVQIFDIVFGIHPSINQREKFWSFMGLLDLTEELCDEGVIQETFTHLVENKLYGTGQALDRDDMQVDREIKDRIVEVLFDKFPYLSGYGESVEDLKDRYYYDYDALKKDA